MSGAGRRARPRAVESGTAGAVDPLCHSERSEESRIFLDARLRTPMHGCDVRVR